MSLEKSAGDLATVQAADMETERKFIVPDVGSDVLSYAGNLIIQGYVRVRGEVETRIRNEDGERSFAAKFGSGLERPHYEIPISAERYEQIHPLTAEREVEKVRRKIPYGKRAIELDIYGGKAEGLAVAEVEFPSRQVANHFSPPCWFGREVTNDSHYKNQQIALFGHPDKQSSQAVPVNEVPIAEGVQALNAYAETFEQALGRPIIIAVAGGSASGKTSAVASRVAEHFGEEALAISLDDYLKGVSYMKDYEQRTGRHLSFDDPQVVDTQLAREHLQALRAGQTIQKPCHDFKIGERTASTETKLGNKKIIVVEGLFALGDDLADIADITCFVNAETHGRIMRRLMRDLERTSWQSNEILGYLRTLESEHQLHVQPTIGNADIIINNNYDPVIEAHRAGLFEKQIKFPSGRLSHDDLTRLGAELVAPAVEQVDMFSNPAGVNLADSDETVRLRQANGSITFGYKGPRLADETIRRRPKIEIPIDAETAEGLKQLYPEPTKQVSKRRSTFLVDDVLVMFDENVVVEDVQGNHRSIGDFLELRGSTKTKIEKVRQQLGLESDAADTRAYFDM